MSPIAKQPAAINDINTGLQTIGHSGQQCRGVTRDRLMRMTDEQWDEVTPPT
ncbi:MAG: hypothetical protein R3C05_24895 [Pirellulaceae bacterium]